MRYFAMDEDLRGTDLSDPATYAAFLGITEPPVAVHMRTAWGNGCNLKCLLCTLNFVYVVEYTNG